MHGALAFLDAAVASRHRSHVCVCSVNMVMTARWDPMLRRALATAGLVVPDGSPIARAVRRSAAVAVEQVRGTDLLLRASERAAGRGYRFFFYGGHDGVADELARMLRQRHPRLRVVGTYAPPFRSLRPEEDEDVVRRINAAAPDVVWVGLGCPKQERWMVEHRERLDAPLLIGVGAAFDFASGRKRQAPRWVQRLGVEWAWRFFQEPRRLWRRVLVEGPAFYALLAAERWAARRARRKALKTRARLPRERTNRAASPGAGRARSGPGEP